MALGDFLRKGVATKAWLDVLSTAAKDTTPVTPAEREAFERSSARDFAVRLAALVEARKLDVKELRSLMGGK